MEEVPFALNLEARVGLGRLRSWGKELQAEKVKVQVNDLQQMWKVVSGPVTCARDRRKY